MASIRERRGRRSRDDRGAVAIMMSLSLVALLVIVAMTLDFGLARLDRQANKAATDAAVAAGMRELDGGTGQVYSFRGVCEAIEYLKVNRPALSPLSWSRCNGSETGTVCDPSNPATHATFQQTITSTDGRTTYAVDIRIPYTQADMQKFPEDDPSTGLAVTINDQGDPAEGGCDQLGVVISQSRKPGLGSLAGVDELGSVVRSVGRVAEKEDGQGAVALLLLEREDCNVLSADGAGSAILVKGNGEMPGMIHVDSDGSGDDCTSNKVLDGNHPNGIVAEQSEIAPVKDAVLSVRALNGDPGAVPANASDPYPDVVARPHPPNEPVGRGLITRSPVDHRWLNGVRTTVSTAAANWLYPPAAGPGVTVETNCTGGAGPSNPNTRTETGTVVFACPDAGKNYPADVTLQANQVIFTQGVWITGAFRMPNASEVYVRGVPGGDAIQVKNNASFQMHTAGRTVSDPTFARQVCTEGNPSGRAKLVVGAGKISMQAATGHIQLCNTTVIMLGNQPDACLPSTTPTPPTTNSCDGFININGGAIDWTAPNEEDLIPEGDGPMHWDQLEDLAFWSEAEDTSNSTTHRIMGGGEMHLSGVFMLPNANPFQIGGGGLQDVENSQYVARRLAVNGGGVLTMKPDPNDSFKVNILGGFELVR